MEEFDKKAAVKIFSGVGIALTVLVLVTYVTQAAVLLGLGGWISANHDTYLRIQALIATLPMYLIAVPACILCFKRLPAYRIEPSSWKIGKLFIVFLIAYGMMYVTNIFGTVLMYGVGILRGKPVTNNLLEIVEQSNLWVLALCTVVLAPIIEEVIFRKLLIDRIYLFGDKVCILVSGILFGVMHGNFYQFFYAFALGAVFAYVYVKTGRLRYCITFHMIINFLGSIVAMLILKYMDEIGITENPMAIYQHMLGVLTILGYFGMVFFGAIAGIVLLCCNIKNISFEAGDVTIPKGQRFKTIFLNVGVILFFACNAVNFWASLG